MLAKRAIVILHLIAELQLAEVDAHYFIARWRLLDLDRCAAGFFPPIRFQSPGHRRTPHDFQMWQ
jgi:hypothetical protein